MRSAEELIRSSDLPRPLTADGLIASLVPRVGLTGLPWVPTRLPLGASRFGGPADLTAGVDWPTIDGRPLLLLTQLNFGDLRIEREMKLLKSLPPRGWLCLFLDVDKGAIGELAPLQFDGEAEQLIRHDPEPAADAETWTQCHAVTVYPADHDLCLPCIDAVDSAVLPSGRDECHDAYDELQSGVEDLARSRHRVKLLGSPTLFNPDIRSEFENPKDWMQLLEFDGDCPWLASVRYRRDHSLDRPSLGSADFVQYFVRKSDYLAGRLSLGRVGYMLS